MKEYRVDFSKVKSLWDLHYALKVGLELPDYYGMNMDALWDMLTGYVEYPAIIWLVGIESMPKDLNGKITVMFEIFDDLVEDYSDGRFTVKKID